MKHLKILKDWKSKFPIYEDYKDINAICRKYGIQNYTINKDGTIDVDGDVNLSYKNLEKLPLNFGKVGGNFYCFNSSLTTLEGSPREVGGGFYFWKEVLERWVVIFIVNIIT